MHRVIKHLSSRVRQPLISLKILKAIAVWSAVTILIGLIGIFSFILFFENKYAGLIYPNVSVAGIPFGGKNPQDVENYWRVKNTPFENAVFEFKSPDMVATVSGMELSLGYDASLSATQAYLIGRSGNFWSDFKTKYFTKNIDVHPLFRYNTDLINQTLDDFSAALDIPAQDALFSFQNNKVTAFKPSKTGSKVNQKQAKKLFSELAFNIPNSTSLFTVIDVPVDKVEPVIATDKANAFGIKELIGSGYSEFAGSIPGRIHNVILAASRFNGVLIGPGVTLSFNKTLGDVSAANGYQPAYIIKDGRTILGDGGGVCQVSTTLFRAALNAGLPIIERHAHAYRVHYYEEGGAKPGLDATVFDPSDDLKIKNDTPGYILIQTKSDLDKQSLTFDLYGQSDGREAQLYDFSLTGITPPPPDRYDDDPTLNVGVIKQVDFAAWGAKASFKYKVTRANVILEDTEFDSNFRPWQAVYLKGTKE